MKQRAQFLWVGSTLSTMELMCLRSFLAIGYDVHLYAYDAIRDVPAGVQILDGREILGDDRIFRDQEGSFTSFADQFRLHLLERKGGWWFDMDFLAVRPMPEPQDLLFASTWEYEYGQCVVNSAIWCRPQDERIGWLRRRCDEMIASGGVEFASTGPHLINQLLRLRPDLRARIAPWWEFCPFPWRLTRRMAFETNKDLVRDRLQLAKHLVYERLGSNLRASYVRSSTRAVHWHNEIWRRAGLDKNKLYHPLSPYGRAQRQYAPELI